MDKIKEYGNKAIAWVKNWYITNWNGGMFNRGKTIFISFTILMFLIKVHKVSQNIHFNTKINYHYLRFKFTNSTWS